jgi:hypothetical protein
MDIKDVLLTDEEAWPINTIAFSIAHEHHMGLADGELVREACKLAQPNLCKAQCLKLLEWGRIHCQEHYPSLEYIDDCPRRFDCPSCMVIIEKLLKEESNG